MNSHAKSGGRMPALFSAILPALLYTLLVEILDSVLLSLLQHLSSTGSDAVFSFIKNHAQSLQALVSAISCAAACAVLLSAAKEERRRFLAARKTPRMESAWETQVRAVPGGERTISLLLLASAVFLSLGINLVLSLTGLAGLSGAAGQMSANTLQDPAYPVLSLLVYGLLTPAAEETVFRDLCFLRLRGVFAKREERRGSLFRNLLAASGTVPAALLSSALFALYHGNLPQGIYAFLMGLLFALSVEITGNPVTAILLHSASNIFILLLSLPGLYNELCTPVWCACFLLPGLSFLALLLVLLERGRGSAARP